MWKNLNKTDIFIDQSLKRIISEKERIGMFDKNTDVWNKVEKSIKIKKHTKIAQQIANESITLVKDEYNFIPLDIRKFKKC